MSSINGISSISGIRQLKFGADRQTLAAVNWTIADTPLIGGTPVVSNGQMMSGINTTVELGFGWGSLGSATSKFEYGISRGDYLPSTWTTIAQGSPVAASGGPIGGIIVESGDWVWWRITPMSIGSGGTEVTVTIENRSLGGATIDTFTYTVNSLVGG